jgi:hypothetical protein
MAKSVVLHGKSRTEACSFDLNRWLAGVSATDPFDLLLNGLTLLSNLKIRTGLINACAAVFADNIFQQTEEQAIYERPPICRYGRRDLVLGHAQPVTSARDGGAQLSRNA